MSAGTSFPAVYFLPAVTPLTRRLLVYFDSGAYSTVGKDRAKLSIDLPNTKDLPICSNDEPEKGADLPYSVRDSTDGEKRAGVVKCIAALSLDDDSDFDDVATLAGVSALRTVYYFFHLRLYMIKSTLPGAEYSALKDAFIAKYAGPSISTAKYQNALGATFDGETLLWKNGISQISLGERDGEHDSSLVDELKDSDVRIRSTVARTAAIGKGYEANKISYVYGEMLQYVRDQNKAALRATNVLLTIWHDALRKECEVAGAVNRQKDF